MHAQMRRCVGCGSEARRLARQRSTAMLGRDRVARDAHRALLRLQFDAYLRWGHLDDAAAVAPAMRVSGRSGFQGPVILLLKKPYNQPYTPTECMLSSSRFTTARKYP